MTQVLMGALVSVLTDRGYRRSSLGLFERDAELWRKGDKVVEIPYKLTTSDAEKVVTAIAAAEEMPFSAVINEVEDAAHAYAMWQANN